VQKAQANKTHFAISALQYMGYLDTGIITQNVDRWARFSDARGVCTMTNATGSDPLPRLQHKAMASPQVAADSILELHGSLKHVNCLSGSLYEPTVADRACAPLTMLQPRLQNGLRS
jgi:NAD-dependent SIR2 family protein deacetylase